MSLTIALAAVLAIAAIAGWLGFSRASRLRGTSRLHSLPVYHAAYAALWAALPALLFLAVWSPVQSRFVDQAVLASPEGRALPAFEMQRELILSEAREIAQRRARRRVQSRILDAGAPFRGSRKPLRDDRRRHRDPARARFGGVRAAPHLAAVPRPHRGRAMADGGADRGLADRHPDDARHPAVADVREPALLQAGAADGIPVRHPVEPADGAAPRPGRIVGRVRLDPIVLGHGVHRRDHRHDRRHPAGADERDLSDPIRAPAGALVDEADPRDPRRRADRGLRLFRRADRRSPRPRPRHCRSASPRPAAKARSPRAW